MIIRTAKEEDLDNIVALEAECFPPSEAASAEEFAERLERYKDHFWLMFDDDGILIAFVDGFASDEEVLSDEMFADASMHDPQGRWQMIFGVNTKPSNRRQGHAGTLIKRCIEDAKEQGRSGVILTCKEKLLGFYAQFGFKNEGLSTSSHGGAKWYQMRLEF